jgi:primosomal protein N' (replication factor Y)
MESGFVDVLIGTQMVAKGLDFEGVELVGVFDIDRMIHFPDFRARERAFQIITQVAGRAGRRTGKGRVIIQTGQPTHSLLRKIVDNDYIGFYDEEVLERQTFGYPPFGYLIQVTFRGDSRNQVDAAAQQLAGRLTTHLGKNRILGPQEPNVGKIRNLYISELFLKLEAQSINLKAVKERLRTEIDTLAGDRKWGKIGVILTIDPT